MENRKIKNATPTSFDGIEFKSKLECSFYKTIKEEGLDVDYEPVTFTLFRGFKPTVPFYNRGKRSRIFKLNMKEVRPITYTPDFIVTHNDKGFIIEVKGIENDTYPLKRKMFRKYLEDMGDPYVAFFEIHTKKELLEVIDKIKSYECTG